MANSTPGPWILGRAIFPRSQTHVWVKNSYGNIIADVRNGEDVPRKETGDDTCEANALLIAASPTAYDLIYEAVHGRGVDSDDDWQERAKKYLEAVNA